MFHINVIMDRFKLILCMKLARFQDRLCNDPPVQHGILLHDMHVVNVIVKQSAFAPGHFIGDCHLGCGGRRLPLFQEFADFFLPARIPQLLNKGFPLRSDFRLSLFPQGVQAFVSGSLVILGYVFPRAPGPRMYHKPDVVLFVPIQFPEMVASAQRSQAERKHLQRNLTIRFPKAGQGIGGQGLRQAVRCSAHPHSGRDFRLGNAVEFRQVNPLFF